MSYPRPSDTPPLGSLHRQKEPTAVQLLLWIVIVFVLVVVLAVLVSPPSPDAPRGMPQNRGRYKDE